MSNIPMKLDYSKTINEQLATFNYYKNRYSCYEIMILDLQKEVKDLYTKIECEANLTKTEHDALEELLNIELNDYFCEGYCKSDPYIIILRSLIKKLGCKETYPYDKWFDEEYLDDSNMPRWEDEDEK